MATNTPISQAFLFQRTIEHLYSNITYDVQFFIMEVDYESFDPATSDHPNVKYKMGISPEGIIKFTLSETLADWNTKGELIFRYVIDGSIDTINKQSNTTQNNQIRQLQNDGSDVLYVRIIPNEKQMVTLASQGVDITDWKLEYTFAINRIEDIDSPVGLEGVATNAANKVKKLFLEDYKYQKLKTSNILYSSYMPSKGEAPNSRSNGLKETGLILKDVITFAGIGDSLPKDTDIDSWDIGANKTFYTSSAEDMASDDLKYILDMHSSIIKTPIKFNVGELKSTLKNPTEENTDVYDFCILENKRISTTNGLDVINTKQPMYLGGLTLIPMHKYFEKAGKTASEPGSLQTEHFFITDDLPDANSSANIQPNRAPLNSGKPNKTDSKLAGYVEILKYTFTDIPPDINSALFKNTPVHSTDMSTGTFKLDLLANRVETARRFIAQKYINNLYKESHGTTGNEEDYFLINLNKTKSLFNMNPTYSLYGDSSSSAIRQTAGLQKLLKLGVFLNTGINFRINGLTSRKTGVFIGIDKLNGADPDSSLDNRLLGQYFVIAVSHVFEGTAYYNDITAIKIHNFIPIPKYAGNL